MSDENQFIIDLNESLYFESGQEISDMLNISLDPNISVQSMNDSVFIRGQIELQGEYQKSANLREELPLDLMDYHSRRYVEKVEDRSGEVASFYHAFPIDITVPADRVEDLNDIMVNVEWFDYDLPSDHQLILTSKIAIEGISSLRQTEEVPSVTESFDLADDRVELFEFQTQPIEDSETLPVNKADNTPKISEQPLIRDTEEQAELELESTGQSIADYFTRAQSAAKEVGLQDERADEQHDYLDEDEAEAELLEQREIEEDMSQDMSEEEREEQLSDVSYLADMFKEKAEDGVEFSQLRICIVQEDDTLETIADKYEVPKLQLLKQNRLDGDDLTEGQLLLIPERKSKQQS